MALIHSNSEIKPINEVNEALFFNDKTRNILQSHSGITETQSYTWPHLMRNNSLILIDKQSVDTAASYIPVIFTLMQVITVNKNVSATTIINFIFVHAPTG